MLKASDFGPITVYSMGRSVGSFVLFYVHAFMIGDTLIDTGTRYVQDEFLKALKGKQVKTIINTHHHEDHTGNNQAIQREFGAKIYAHRDALRYLKNPSDMNLKLYQKIFWGLPQPSIGELIGRDVKIDNYKFEVIISPGHSIDHICLYQPDNGWLFTGDIFCGKKILYLRRDEDYNTTLDSLKKLAGLDVKTIFCGLKGVVSNGGAALRGKIYFMEDIRNKVIKLHQQGTSSVAIREKLFGNEDMRDIVTNGHYTKQFIVDNILAGRF